MLIQPDTRAAGHRGRMAGTRPGSPPRLLLMLFGDYWLEPSEGLPSAALVTLLSDFGVNDAAARAALSRMVKRELLVPTRTGRNTYYRASARGKAILRAASWRIAEFGSSHDDWTGEWSVVAFTIPDNSRSLRAGARNRLGWLGFAPLYDDVWVCPHDRHEDAVRELATLGVIATPLQATVAASEWPIRLPQAAWNLDQIARRYHDFLDRTAGVRTLLKERRVRPEEAIVHRTRLLEDWLDLSSRDPDLPAALLPPDWPRTSARDAFLETHEALGVLATERVRRVVAAIDDGLAASVEFRTTADWTRPVA
jgi:phenylacetic acid degradation operon negative regulatory protein